MSECANYPCGAAFNRPGAGFQEPHRVATLWGRAGILFRISSAMLTSLHQAKEAVAHEMKRAGVCPGELESGFIRELRPAGREETRWVRTEDHYHADYFPDVATEARWRLGAYAETPPGSPR